MIRIVALILVGLCCFAQSDEMAAESQRARQMMASGQFTQAIPIYEKLVQALPGNPGLRLNLAIAMHMAGEDRKAIPQFEAVLKQQPTALPALMLLGASYLRTGTPAKAVLLLEKAMAIAPDDLQGRAMLADALLMLNRYEAALPHLRKLAAAEPNNPRAWFGLGRAYEAVAQRAFEALEKLGPDSPWWLMLAAEVRLNLGRNTAAYTLYRAALDKQPNFRGGHAGLAEVYRKTDHADWAAIEDQLEAKIPPPACATPNSECHMFKGRVEQALTLALARKTAEAIYWQSRAANELSRTSFSRLAQLPPSAESHQVLAEVYRNQGRHADAIAEWKAALAIAPADPRLEQELATSIYMIRDYPAAASMARELIAKDPSVAELHFILGDSMMLQQEPAQAITHLQTALRLRKTYPAAEAVLGRALLQVGQPADAIPHLLAALPIDADGSLHFQLSRAYQDTGQPQKAAAMLKIFEALKQTASSEEITLSPPRP